MSSVPVRPNASNLGYKGLYSAASSYVAGDYVLYTDGKIYVAIAETTNNLPTDEDYWVEMTKGDMLKATYDKDLNGVVDTCDFAPSHYHTAAPLAVDPEFSRLSDAYDDALKRWEYGQRCWDTNGTTIREGTTNMMTSADSLLLSSAANVTVVSGTKYAISCATGEITLSDGGSGVVVPATPVVITASSTTLTLTPTTTATYVQVERKDYRTSWTQGGTTRAAEYFAIPVGATQKNLLTLNQATGGDTLGDTTGFTAVGGSTVTRDTTEAWNGTGSIKVVTPGSVANEGVRVDAPGGLVIGKIHTRSVRVKGSGTIVLLYAGAGVTTGTPVVLSSAWQTVQLARDCDFATANFQVLTSGTESATFYIDGLQLEESTTATDWTTPAVDYTNAVINPTAFSVEFDYVPTSDVKDNFYYLFAVGKDTNNKIQIHTNNSTGYYMVGNVFASGSPKNIISSVAAVAGTKAGHKISVSGNVMTYAINGTTIGTAAYDGLPSLLGLSIYLGASWAGSLPRNGSISNVRIRKTSLTATEMQYTGKLLPDEYTTYYSDCKESISTRPYHRDALGNAVPFLTAESRTSFSNAIVNGDFNLASRGTSFTNPATASFLLVGMQLAFNGSGATRVISQQAFTLGQQEVPGAETFLRIAQTVAPTGQTAQNYTWKLENVNWHNGRRVKLMFYARSPEAISLPSIVVQQNFGTSGSTTVTVATLANVKTLTGMRKYAFELLMPSTAGKTTGAGHHVLIQMNHPLNAAFTLDVADLELKPVESPDVYYRRDIQMQQGLMARYLQKMPANLQLRATNVATNTIDFEYRLPVAMRANPAISGTYAETTNWKVNSLAGVQTTGFALALLNAAPDRVGLRLTKSGHGLTDATLSLVTDILISAEI